MSKVKKYSRAEFVRKARQHALGMGLALTRLGRKFKIKNYKDKKWD